MYSNSSFDAMIASRASQLRTSNNVERTVRQLQAAAADGLVPMFDAKEHLFCHRLRQAEPGPIREGTSRRYTMIALLGLHRLEASGTLSPIEIKPVLDALLADTGWVENVGDLGLLLWVCSLQAPQRLVEVEQGLKIESVLDRFRDARECKTMELAWFLTGLAYRRLEGPENQSDLRNLALEVYKRLRSNQGQLGIFGHLSRKVSIAGMLRGRIGSFADQVYPIYAMTKFAEAFHVMKAKENALDCALTICQAQGPLGQWWWHYDSSSGRVVERYPVYSVHQDGMAPMALFALGESMGSDFGPWIVKGLQWVGGDNELDFDMQETSQQVVWRSIGRLSAKRHWNTAIAFLAQRDDRESRDGLTVAHECRPYHFGWLLYAFAGRGNCLSSAALRQSTL